MPYGFHDGPENGIQFVILRELSQAIRAFGSYMADGSDADVIIAGEDGAKVCEITAAWFRCDLNAARAVWHTMSAEIQSAVREYCPTMCSFINPN